MNTSLETVLEMAFAPPAGMDLGLDDEAVTRKAPGNRFSLFRGAGDSSTGDGDTCRSEKFPCLIFVDVHKSFVVKGGKSPKAPPESTTRIGEIDSYS